MLEVTFQRQISVWCVRAAAVRTRVAMRAGSLGLVSHCLELLSTCTFRTDYGRGKDGTGVIPAAIAIKWVLLTHFSE